MMAMQSMGGGALQRQQESSGLADVVGTILDKGVVIDVFVRVSLVGIEVLRVDARVVVASVDTYLRFAEAANRLEMGSREPDGIADVVGSISEASAHGIASGKVKGALDAGLDRLGMLKPDARSRSAHRR